MGFLDKVKDKVKGKSIEREVDEAFADNSYSRRVLDANARMQKPNELSPDYFRARQNPAPRSPLAPQQAQRPDPLAARSAQNGRAYPQPIDEDEFLRRRYGTDDSVHGRDTHPLGDPLEPHGFTEEKKADLPPLRPSFGVNVADQSTEKVLDNINIALKDLRAQNNHIIDLLRNIQDRLSRY